ncbi:choline transport protein [Aspergillus aculeatinus CBS 121060]|uniref:Choline transport protein n=1 Tax=Aspergillus aculeatinus CBS 121060 TaxID=1448322 RepID=A0ACD1H2Y1_9EURO|nr:choline transport protein [Aspergillus aculeatinus CBS 121060]RAH67844.1 choline transport protein [Aspergillus aculeatinus CBS 121060]
MRERSPAESVVELTSIVAEGPSVLHRGNVVLCTRDALELAQVGKKEVLKRRFGLASTVGFACSLMLTWEAFLMLCVGVNLVPSGGPAGLVYGYIAVWIGFISIFTALGELASMIPSAGGQYHWASILAPESSKRFISHVTGEGSICIIAWTAVPTGAVYVAGSILQNAVAMKRPDYEPEGWHVTLIMWGILLICAILNTWLGMILPVLEVFIGIVHVLGFFAVLIPIVYLGPKADARSVFVQTFNVGGWRDITLATFVGLKGIVGAFLGMSGGPSLQRDMRADMAEEVANSTMVVPHSMLFAIAINGVLGFAMLIAFLFTAGDLSAVLKSDAPYPFMQILESATQSTGAAIVFSSIIAIMQACCGLGGISSGSRMLWAFSREQALPGWRWILQLNKRTSVPFHSICVIVIAAGLIGLINIGSSVVLNIVLSLLMEAFFFSYVIPLSLLLYRRVKGHISEPQQGGGDNKGFVWGPFRVRGWLGIANNIFALVFSGIVVIFGFWPANSHPTPSHMNYSVAIFGGVLILAVGYYLGWGRKHYMGPLAEVEVAAGSVEQRRGERGL